MNSVKIMFLRQALMLEGQGVVSLVGAGGKTTLMFKLAQEISRAGQPVLTTTTTKISVPDPAQSSCLIISDGVETIVNQARDLLNKKALHITVATSRGLPENKLIGLPPATVDVLCKTKLFRWIIVEADGAAGKPLKVPANYEPVIPESTKLVIGLVGLSAVGKPLTDQWVHRRELFSRMTGLAAEKEISEAAVCDVLLHERGVFKSTPAKALRMVFLNQADTPGGCEAGKQIADLLIKKKQADLKRVIIAQLMKEPPVLEYYEMSI